MRGPRRASLASIFTVLGSEIEGLPDAASKCANMAAMLSILASWATSRRLEGVLHRGHSALRSSDCVMHALRIAPCAVACLERSGLGEGGE